MTRTLFVGEPGERDLDRLRARRAAQAAAIAALERPSPGRRAVAVRPGHRRVARDVITAAGHGERFGHGTGHGIGLATHEAPSLARPPGRPLPSPTVFSVEPGVYLDGEMGVRIEDLVAARRRSRSGGAPDRFPRDVLVVGACPGRSCGRSAGCACVVLATVIVALACGAAPPPPDA